MVKKDFKDLMTEIADFLAVVGAEEGILFGSRAKGEELKTSDVDLIVISHKFAQQPFPERLVHLQQHWKLPLFLEALAYTPDELKRLAKTRGVVAEALKSGKKIKPKRVA